MDNLDSKIDTLIRDKLVSLIQENAVRIKRITIKYTKFNKKHTVDHWQAFVDSYGKLFRNIPKDLCRVEKEVRIKFVSDLTEERINRFQTMVNSEVEVLFNKLSDEAREEFEKLGQVAVFDEAVERFRSLLAENLDKQIQKCMDAIQQEIGQGQKTGVQDLIDQYEVKETLLHEINIISPLQSVNSLLSRINGDARLAEMTDSLQEGFRKLFQDLQESRTHDTATKEARKILKMEVARNTMTVREIVVNSLPFLEQLALPVERRNAEVIRKSWKNFFDILEGREGPWEKVIPHFQPLYHFMCDEDQ